MKHIKIYESFDWQDYDDTDIAGPLMEIAIDNLIEQTVELLNKEFPNGKYPDKDRSDAVKNIKLLWIEKIKSTLK